MVKKKKSSLYDLVGILSKEEAEEMKKHIKELREKSEERIKEVAAKMNKKY